MGFSLLPKEDAYFTYFSEMAATIVKAATILEEMIATDDGDLESFSKRIKEAEHACDEVAHQITTKLNSSFITPFDREDIYTLTVALDDVCDYIDASARAIIMYNIGYFSDYARNLTKVITKLAIEVNSAAAVLRKPTNINQHFVEIHRLENEADDIYFRAIADLFHNSSDPLNIIKWKELYELLETATDRCEHVANIIESIVLKHN